MRRRLLAALGAVAGLAGLAGPAAGTAFADGPRPGPYHGGAADEEPVLAYLLVGRGGTSLDAAITLRARCDAFAVPVQARVAVIDAALDAEGEAVAVKSITGPVSGPDGEPATEDGEATVRVRVGDDGRARGTVRLASVFRDADTGEEVARCDTGELAFAVRQVPSKRARGGRRGVAAGTLLAGRAGVQPFVARVDEDGGLEGLALVYRSGCQLRADGRGTRRIVALPRFAVRSDGTFAVRATNQLFVPGGVEDVRVELRGRLRADGTIAGTVRLRGVLARGDEEATRCDSGRLTVRALPA
jgi:hypothetical protein